MHWYSVSNLTYGDSYDEETKRAVPTFLLWMAPASVSVPIRVHKLHSSEQLIALRR